MKPKDSNYSDKWAVLMGERESKPIVVRYNQTLKEFGGYQDFIYQLGIAVPFINPTSNGLPSQQEGNDLDSFEDQLENIFDMGGEAIHAVTITFNNMREFVFYTKNGNQAVFESKLSNLKETTKTAYQPQLILQLDKEWKIFKEFATALYK